MFFLLTFQFVYYNSRSTGRYIYRAQKQNQLISGKSTCIYIKNATLSGPYRQNLTKLKKTTSNEVSKCSGCCVNLHRCEMCEGGLGGVERHYNPSTFKKCLQKNLSWKVSILQLLKC